MINILIIILILIIMTICSNNSNNAYYNIGKFPVDLDIHPLKLSKARGRSPEIPDSWFVDWPRSRTQLG